MHFTYKCLWIDLRDRSTAIELHVMLSDPAAIFHDFDVLLKLIGCDCAVIHGSFGNEQHARLW